MFRFSKIIAVLALPFLLVESFGVPPYQPPNNNQLGDKRFGFEIGLTHSTRRYEINKPIDSTVETRNGAGGFFKYVVNEKNELGLSLFLGPGISYKYLIYRSSTHNLSFRIHGASEFAMPLKIYGKFKSTSYGYVGFLYSRKFFILKSEFQICTGLNFAAQNVLYQFIPFHEVAYGSAVFPYIDEFLIRERMFLIPLSISKKIYNAIVTIGTEIPYYIETSGYKRIHLSMNENFEYEKEELKSDVKVRNDFRITITLKWIWGPIVSMEKN